MNCLLIAQNHAAILIAQLTLTTIATAAVVPSTVDSGGHRTTSASYVIDGSLGGLGGISTAGAAVTRHGFSGQLTEVSGLSVTGTPSQVNEGTASQLSGIALLDDDTITTVTDNEINWSLPVWPILSINASGIASAAVVYANTSATVNGSYLGVLGSGSLLVLDTIPDNYGSYAGDGLPDSWQNLYFGLDNPNAAPNKDVTGTGQNNLFKYVAGLDPTNAASRFILRLAAVPGQPSQKRLIFTPRWNDRIYTPLCCTNLAASADWWELTSTSTGDNGNERTIIDLNATEPRKFYRIQIILP